MTDRHTPAKPGRPNDPTAGTTDQPNLSMQNKDGNDTRPSDTLGSPGAEAKSGAPMTVEAPRRGPDGTPIDGGSQPPRGDRKTEDRS